MDRLISVTALWHHLRAENTNVEAEALITLTALGAQSAELLHLLKASRQPLGSVPSAGLQQELSRYGQHRFKVLAKKQQLCHLFAPLGHEISHSPYWLTPNWLLSLYTVPDMLFLLYYYESSRCAINGYQQALDTLWQWHLKRTLVVIISQMLMDSGQWDELYGHNMEIIAIDHVRKRCLVLSNKPVNHNPFEYQHEWRPLIPQVLRHFDNKQFA
ncbi:hypothetical protein LRP52_40860 [Photobacterium sp. ZSDE20]|uniref:Uncharacterized protein n=1 Tax=Photobacterium pectinilyticum TaxID=2906793 RepID=A0ABT1N7S0_9GAMM|nr:hypothetical protein [Photobacterium sp. ZSDE20]MCQ1060798.1 hypothetical protein [Photobacterium sp. ZSDE20]MDD1828536.1 hypothetical protein [Photobacterium sp. ZSDE20]